MLLSTGKDALWSEQIAAFGLQIREPLVGGGGDDVVVEGPRAGGVGAEEDIGAVEAERVVHGVEHLGGHQLPRQEHASARERRGPPPAAGGGGRRGGGGGGAVRRRHRDSV